MFYAGITTNLERRFNQHQKGNGARFTRANPPIRIVASRQYPDRSAASKAESILKKIPRPLKLAYFD